MDLCQLCSLLRIADKMAISLLKVHCEMQLGFRLDVGNATAILLLASESQAENLESKCFNFILEHGKEISRLVIGVIYCIIV